MTNAIYFTDLHADDYKAFGFKRDRLEDCLLVIDDVYKLALKKEAKIILFSGDFFNTTKFLYTTVVNRVMQRMAKWISVHPDIVWYAITGNHDFATKNLPDKPAVSALEHLATAFPDTFKILDNISIVVGKHLAIVTGIPNYEYPEHFKRQLKITSDWVRGYKNSAPKVQVTLMIHQLPMAEGEGMKADVNFADPLFEPFDLVVCGDDHTAKRLSSKFLVGGNPLHKDLKDAGKDKGIYYLDLENPTGIKFVNRKGRYPEFKKVKAGEPLPDDATDFLVQSQEQNIDVEAGAALVEEFGADLSQETLIINYWKTKGKGDKALLEMGLSFVR